ncbi:hypothetical protein [Anoxybacter fermentans]|uniref:hypothetical protein n=1 Tax=Anoxybacter fermentans TaxID=1323375 RepID=UPI0013DE96E6|nr:hypothetical protein [Anoxybacter fermentans]
MIRIAKNVTKMTWRNLHHELDKIKTRNSGDVYQCMELNNEQFNIFEMMGIKKPPRDLKTEPKS